MLIFFLLGFFFVFTFYFPIVYCIFLINNSIFHDSNTYKLLPFYICGSQFWSSMLINYFSHAYQKMGKKVIYGVMLKLFYLMLPDKVWCEMVFL